MLSHQQTAWSIVRSQVPMSEKHCDGWSTGKHAVNLLPKRSEPCSPTITTRLSPHPQCSDIERDSQNSVK